jgi:MFS family permease
MMSLPRRQAIVVFLVLAFAYFLSALIRAITATLSPALTQEFSLGASDLGLLAGGYFLGFAVMQLPLGSWLDRHGPRRVILCFLSVAVLGCLAFAMAHSFVGLLAARVLCGVGVSACLMAPLTGYRRWLEPGSMMRANAWMLMAGSLGMVASTLPVQWLVPLVGWRAVFVGLGMAVALAMVLIAWQVPQWRMNSGPQVEQASVLGGYSEVWRHPYFRQMTPLGFFTFGGLVAIQTLWAAPWMIKVAGRSPLEAASGLFWINVSMMAAFWAWGMANPWLVRRRWDADRLIQVGLPASFLLLAILIIAVESISAWAGVLFSLYCVSCTCVALAQPAVGMVFAPTVAGRALSAYNLVIFAGVFVVQWGIGLLVDGFKALGLAEVASFQLAMAVYLASSIAAYVHFLVVKRHNQSR